MNQEEKELFLLKEFKQLVAANMSDNNLANEWIAAQLQISSRSLYRIVRKHSGQSPNQYIRGIRLAKAYELLSLGGVITVKEVVSKVGFIKTVYFSRIFKAEFGVKPSDI